MMRNASEDARYKQWRTIAPCPFCGGPPKIMVEENKEGVTMAAQIQCENCGAGGPLIRRGKNRMTGELERTDPGTTALTVWCSRRA